MENSLRPSADRLLVALKLRGPQTVADLGCAAGVCGEAARQQLVRLAADGLVAATTSPSRGVGRPRQVWSLTPAGNARFPDGHAQLAADLIRLIRTQLGDDALVRLIEARAAESRRAYVAAMKDVSDLGEKVARFAEIRTREGYMAEWLRVGDGYLIVENHCPICVAASGCAAFARAELAAIRAAFGRNVSVEPTDHVVGGDRRFAYRITPRAVRRVSSKRARSRPRRQRHL